MPQTRGPRSRPVKRPARSGRTRRRRKPSRLRLLFGLALVLVLATGLAVAAAGIHYYGKFNRMLEARLEAGRPVQTEVYSRPEVLLQGQRASREAILDRLLDLSYQAGRTREGPWFESTPAGLMLSQKEDREKIRIEFDNQRISRIVVNDQPVLAVELQPQFLTSLFGEKRRQQRRLTFAELPDVLVKAVLAAEDSRFFEHRGISPLGIARAAIVDLIHWERRQGGSTLTQQFIKNYFLTPEKDVMRKVEEIAFSLFLERRLSKQQIFELYANEVYLGQVGTFAIQGLGQGARVYFGKPVERLNLAEAATLAAIIPAPNRLSPYRAAEEVRQRRNGVLARMEELSFITTRDYAEACQIPLGVLPPSRQNFAVAPYFVDFVSSLQGPAAAQARNSLVVHTTLDPFLQKVAFESVAQGLEGLREKLASRKNRPQPQAALLAVDPRTGEILAMVGGQDYARVQFNHAVNGSRQPGSTFKPFVYAAALEQAPRQGLPLSLASQFVDEPYSLAFGNGIYRPHNYQNKYYGTVTLREALSRSLNVPSVKLAQLVGFDKIRSSLLRFGFNDSIKAYPSLALGAFEVSLLELVQGYQVLANGGLRIPLNAIRSIERDGVEEINEVSNQGQRVISEEVAYLITSALRSTLDEGTGRSARSLGFQLPASGKTGSTEDSWFVGYTPEIVCGVWVGSESETPLDLSGAAAALPIWTLFMKGAQQMDYFAGREPVRPEGVLVLPIDPRTGKRAEQACPQQVQEYFLPGTEPTETCRH